MKTYIAAFIYKQAPKNVTETEKYIFVILHSNCRICFLIHLDSYNFFPKTMDLQMMVAIIRFVRRNSKLENK